MHSHTHALPLCKNNGAFKNAGGVNTMYLWVEKSEFALGRVCVNHLHVDCITGYLSLSVIRKAELFLCRLRVLSYVSQ